jgi:hypothetical protein
VSTSNVRNIESLEAFHAGLVRLAGDWDATLQEIRMMVQRAETYFAQDRPAYWRRQTQLAERELNEAKDNLAQKRAAIRPGDRPPATEAAKRVKKAEDRLQQCREKQRASKVWAIEISQQCDGLLGPLADVVEHCEVLLPSAADELRRLIDQLRLYAEQQKPGT